MKDARFSQIKLELDRLVDRYQQPDFIAEDPICVPHEYESTGDIEIAGLIAALFSWGQRKTIIHKSRSFLSLMGKSPHAFIMECREKDLKRFQDFRHRTFLGKDATGLLHFLKNVYQKEDGLQSYFSGHPSEPVYHGLSALARDFARHPAVWERSRKHISSPERKSACKRLNMFLRWMVRSNEGGVDFGRWTCLSPADLIIPLDVHVFRSARGLGLLRSRQANWKAAIELTDWLRMWDPDDPVRYDFALFQLGRTGRSAFE